MTRINFRKRGATSRLFGLCPATCLSIDSNCSLSCKDGQVTCRTDSHLILEAAKRGVALIICESFKPVSLLLPATHANTPAG